MQSLIANVVILVSLIGCSAAALGQGNLKAGVQYTLPTGIKVETLPAPSLVLPEKEQKGPTLALAIRTPNIKNEQVDQAGDTFFMHFWLSALEAKGEKHATILVQVPGASAPVGKETVGLFRTLEYERKEPRLWVPTGRPIPDWAKATEGEKIQLSDGKAVWIERSLPFVSQVTNSNAIGLNVRGEWTTSGSRPALDQIRGLAADGLQELRGKYDLIQIYFFGEPAKDGFHVRPQQRAFILRKKPNDFWVVESFQFTMFTEGGKALMIWYVPSKPFESLNAELLDKEATFLHEQVGKGIADKAKLDAVIVLAKWPADNVGDQVRRYGTVFRKDQKGEWKVEPPGKK